jgi:hypothetical protein
METILATALGCAVNVQGGESDELTKAANIIFRSLDEGSATNFHLMIVLSSKILHNIATVNVVATGHLPMYNI